MSVEKPLEHFFHEVDQFLDAVDATPTNMQLQVSTNIVEATLDNIKLVWNERNVPVGGVLTIGINPDKIEIVLKTPEFPYLKMRFFEGEQWNYIAGRWILADNPAPYNYSPALICHSMMDGLQLTGTPTPDTVNGVDTTHYEFEDVSLLTGSYLFNSGSDQDRLLRVYSGDVWLTEDGWPVRLESRSVGTYPSGRELSLEVSLDITDVNSEDVAVEPPF